MQNTEIQTDRFEYSKQVAGKFIQLCKDGKIMYSDEVKILTYLAEKYDPVTVSDYSRFIKKPYKVVKDWINNRKLAFQTIGGVQFILKELN